MQKEKSAYGVYIQAVDGKLYTADGWDSSMEANGVAVVDKRCSFVIAKQQYEGLKWTPTQFLVEGIYTNPSTATADFGGQLNTGKIVEQAGDGEYAAKACHDYIFPDGTNGYMPACGELDVMFDHIDDVDLCMEAAGGSPITSSEYWSSSQVNANAAFTASRGGYRGGEAKSRTYYPTLPFKPI